MQRTTHFISLCVIPWLLLTIVCSCKKTTKDVKKDDDLSVIVNLIDSITHYNAKISANIEEYTPDRIITKGICYSENPNPTIGDSKLINNAPTASFECRLTNLKPGIKYYTKAFLTTNLGTTIYSKERTFSTKPVSVPEISFVKKLFSDAVFEAPLEAFIKDDGGLPVFEKGFCWSLTDTPTVSGLKQVINGMDLKMMLKGLQANQTYYIRPYAKNEFGTGYGETIAIAVDIDGNVYNIVRIGKQLWMMENLKTTTLNDGTPVKNLIDNCDWGTCGIIVVLPGTEVPITPPAYCWYDNDIKNKRVYGALYNQQAVSTNKLAPKGWRVPTYTDFGTLMRFLDPTTEEKSTGTNLYYVSPWVNNKLLLSGSEFWHDSQFPDKMNISNNESGFSAVGAGWRQNLSGEFAYLNMNTAFWTSTLLNAAFSQNLYYNLLLGFGERATFTSHDGSRQGFSVRCVKEE